MTARKRAHEDTRCRSFAPVFGRVCSRRACHGAHLRDQHVNESLAMSNAQAAVVLGASGSVGNALVKELIHHGSFKPIVTLVRRSQPDQRAMALAAGVELRETLVPTMDPAALEIATTEA